ncbi:MAG: YeeE/YedE family protein [Desulfobulbaceae bacterium]|nr:YeeE/YedE family protein [Desulfobulbaceae bacterium]
MNIISALCLGTLFGFVLHRVGATNPHLIIDMLRLKDFHLAKAILLGIAFASSLLFIGMATGMIDPGHLSVKSSYWGVPLGGVILGIGWALAGYCPGTAVAALGEGRKDGAVFVLGGLAGAFAYMLVFAKIKNTFLMDKISGGKVTLAQTESSYDALIQGVPGIIVALAFAMVFALIAWKMPKSEES